jgi:hypothetical protein
MEGLYGNIEGLSARSSQSEKLELSQTQKDYIEELSVSEQDWNKLSIEDKGTHLSHIQDRVTEITENSPLKINDVLKETFGNHIIEDLNKFETSGCPIEGNGGKWEGFRGNSKWIPDRDYIPSSKPSHNNDNGLTMGEIMEKYEIDGIKYENGFPDFSSISKGTVEISDFSDRRYGVGGNFDQADLKLSINESYRHENGYTWHERADCKTMDLVPKEVHDNVKHNGGISVYKSKNNL